MYVRRALLLMTLCLATACNRETTSAIAPESDCPGGERRVTYRLDGGTEISRCVEFDTLLASAGPDCAVAVWTAPDSQHHAEFFRFETDAGDSTSVCGGRFFFGITQNSAGGYTYFDGLVARSFGSGSGPFATGTYEAINYEQRLVAIGHFEFWE